MQADGDPRSGAGPRLGERWRRQPTSRRIRASELPPRTGIHARGTDFRWGRWRWQPTSRRNRASELPPRAGIHARGTDFRWGRWLARIRQGIPAKLPQRQRGSSAASKPDSAFPGSPLWPRGTAGNTAENPRRAPRAGIFLRILKKGALRAPGFCCGFFRKKARSARRDHVADFHKKGALRAPGSFFADFGKKRRAPRAGILRMYNRRRAPRAGIFVADFRKKARFARRALIRLPLQTPKDSTPWESSSARFARRPFLFPGSRERRGATA